MTLASVLAHIVCTGSVPVPGTIHDPTQPLVLGNQANNDYLVVTWDPIAHRCQIQSVYQPPGGLLKQSVLTFDSLGTLLINGQSLATAVPEIANAVSVAQAAAAQATQAAADAQTSENNASTSASTAGAAASDATDAAELSQDFAIAPSGTVLPGGGESAAVSAAKAHDIAQESRDLDVSDPVTADETVLSGHLFTERQVTAAGLVTITVPPDIFSSAEKKARWVAYKLRSATGSVKYQPQAGGTNLTAPTIKARGRVMVRQPAGSGNSLPGAYRTLLVDTPSLAAVTAGEIVAIFHTVSAVSSAALVMNFTTPGTTGLTFSTLVPLPATPGAQKIPSYYVTRAPLNAFAGGAIHMSFQEGPSVWFQCCDWWVLEGTSGLTPLFAAEPSIANKGTANATLLAVPAQSRILVTAAQVGPVGSAIYSSFSSNINVQQFGSTTGLPDGVSDTLDGPNQAYAVGDGLSTVAGDFTTIATFNNATSFKVGMMALAYQPKSVIGGGTVILNKEGGRDTLNVPYGVAELWFQNDGKTVDLQTPKP